MHMAKTTLEFHGRFSFTECPHHRQFQPLVYGCTLPVIQADRWCLAQTESHGDIRQHGIMKPGCRPQHKSNLVTTRYIFLLLHPSPLKSKQANNKQATSKQATLLLSVLGITLFHRFGLYSTLAISYARWCPYRIQVFDQKLTSGAPGWGPQVGETVATLHMRHDCPVTKSSFLPSNSTICPRNGPKKAKKGPE